MATELALTRPEHDLTMDSLRAQMEAAKRYVDSGLLPTNIKTPQQALTIISVGREVGVPPTYALRNIHVIEGKPTCSAELLMALVRRTYGQSAIRVASVTNESCTVEYRETGWDGISSLTFSMDDAKKAGIASKPMWSKYPRAMLRSRAVSEAVRTAFPECIAGLYTPEEVGASVRVTNEGALEIEHDPDAAPLQIAGLARRSSRPDDEVKRLLGAWFGIVDGTSFDNDSARHAFVEMWTDAAGWPLIEQTNSLALFFERCSDDEAARFLADVRAQVQIERQRAADEALAELRRAEPDDQDEMFDTDDPQLQRRPDGARYPR